MPNYYKALAVLSSPNGLAAWFAAIVWSVSHRAGLKPRALLSMVAPAAALGGFAAYVHLVTGRLPQDIEGAIFPSTGYGPLQNGLAAWTASPLWPPAIFSVVTGAIAIAFAPYARRVLGIHAVVFVAGVVGLAAAGGVETVGRATASAFPLYAVLARQARREMVENAIAVSFTIFLGALALLYGGWYAAERLPAAIVPPRDQMAAVITGAGRHLSSSTKPLAVEAPNVLAILGYDPSGRVRSGEALHYGFEVQTLRPGTRGYSLGVHLADRKGRTVASGATTPLRPDWELGREAGHVAKIEVAVPVSSQLPTGVYDAEVVVFDATSWATMPLVDSKSWRRQRVFLDKAVVRRPEEVPVTESRPANIVSANLGGSSFALLGYDLSGASVRPGESLTATVVWKALSKVDVDYTVFVQLLNGEGKLAGQSDSFPVDGRYATSYWGVGETIRDAHRLTVPASASSGAYSVIAGMYRLETMERLAATAENGTSLGDYVALGSIKVEGGRVW